jgi:hypothetical protein
MHYKNGDPAAVGHIVKGPHYAPNVEILGLVVSTVAGTDACNLNVIPLATIYIEGTTRTVLPAVAINGTYSLTAGQSERIA